MEILHRVFDWIGIPILVIVFWIIFFVESQLALRRRTQDKWKRSWINNIISIPSFILLRFIFLPTMIWLSLHNEHWKLGLNYLYNMPNWLEGLIAFVLLDYANYLWHILNHKLPFLWRFHLVHHTDPDLDLTTAVRFHFGEMVGSLFFRGAVVLLTGASPLLVIIYEIIFEAEVLFHHSNTRLPIKLERLLNLLIVTPRMHGIHHSIFKNETDSNYSSILSVWDRIHNTAKLDIHQDDVVIGVPAYHEQQELTIGYLLLLPFKKIRKWKTEYLVRQNVTDHPEKLAE